MRLDMQTSQQLLGLAPWYNLMFRHELMLENVYSFLILLILQAILSLRYPNAH